MSYDPKCLELAEYFLPAGTSGKVKARIAQAVQDAVETEMQAALDELSVKDWRGGSDGR